MFWDVIVQIIIRRKKSLYDFVQNNQLDTSNIQNLFCHKTLQFSGIFCAHHLELFAVNVAIGTLEQPDSLRQQPHNLRETYQLPCVQQVTPDEGHRRCPKHVEFHDKINFGYLMHLVGYFIRNLSRYTAT
jgi:hypothetical protein